MPRPAPPEKLFTHTIRLTRSQKRKLATLGGSEWLRNTISKAQATKHGRNTIEYIRSISARNEDIRNSQKTSRELADQYMLSIKRVQQIRRESN